MAKELGSELDHIKHVVETIEQKVDRNFEKMNEIDGKLENLTSTLNTKFDNINKLINSNQDTNFNYLKEINNVTLFELKNSLKNQILNSANNVESGLAALISNVENVITTNISTYNEMEKKLLNNIIDLLNKNKNK